MNDLEIGDDLEITKITSRTSGGGTWVRGILSGHRFEALVFPEHAEIPEYELEESRISKLWVQRLSDLQTAFTWDRGMEVPAADDDVAALIDFLASGLADHIYAAHTK